MTPLAEIIEEAKRTLGCAVSPACGLPALQTGCELPADLREFYSLCGGIDLFPHEDWGWRILSPVEVARADIELLGGAYEDHPEDYDGTPSERLYLIAVRGCGPDWVSIDLDPSRLGLCLDSFSGDHATDSSKVVARSFHELLFKLFHWREEGYFWEDSYYGFFGDPVEELALRDSKRKRRTLP
jgi:hypothetical protein